MSKVRVGQEDPGEGRARMQRAMAVSGGLPDVLGPRRVVRQLRGGAEERRGKSVVVTGPDSIVQQQFRAEVDVNTIVRRFGVSGPPVDPEIASAAMYGDFSDVVDFESARERVVRAQESFDALPAAVRAKFENDPARFLQYAQLVNPEVLHAELVALATSSAGGDVAPAGTGGVVPPPPAGASAAPAGGSEATK